MFTGLTVATLLGVPAGAWCGWRATFWAVAAIGVVATVVIATLVPKDHGAESTVSLADEVRAVTRPPVLLGLLMTVLGSGSAFTIYTYIQPLLTRVTGFSDAQVAPVLLVFGVGMIVGNLLGGRFADRGLARALLATLSVLTAVMALMYFALPGKAAMVLFTGLLGAAMFATVAPPQLWVLRRAEGAPSLASSLNIGAFNLGNAFGAWLGGAIIAHGFGLPALTWVGALIPVAAPLVALGAIRLERTGADADIGCADPA